MLTKTQDRIMQLFTANITELFTIRGIGKLLNMNPSLAHRSIKPLIENHLLIVNKQKNLALNYKGNQAILSYTEYERRDEFLKKPRNADLSMCLVDLMKKFKEEAFILLIFGSAVIKTNPRDIDILLVVDNFNKTESSQAFLHNTARDYMLEKKLHIVCVSYESVYEMLGRRDERNVMNEVMNNHIILYGAELFYRLLGRGRI